MIQKIPWILKWEVAEQKENPINHAASTYAFNTRNSCMRNKLEDPLSEQEAVLLSWWFQTSREVVILFQALFEAGIISLVNASISGHMLVNGMKKLIFSRREVTWFPWLVLVSIIQNRNL